MAKIRSLAFLGGVPLLFGFLAGQIGGVAGAVIFAFLLVPLLVLPWLGLGTSPLGRGFPLWTLIPLIGCLAGFGAGNASPSFANL